MMGWGEGSGMPFFGAVPILLILIVAGVAIYLVRQSRTTEERFGLTARDILERKYASGELSKEQFEQMKHDLAS